MKLKQLSLINGIALALILTGCSQDRSEKPDGSKTSSISKFQWSEKSVNATSQLNIVNQFGEPVKGAQILIGDAQGNPFKNNFLTTDAAGVATAPAEWVLPASVTVDAAGHVRQTLLNVSPGNLMIKLSPAYIPQRVEVRGRVSQLPVVNGDNLIDFSLVMPSVAKSDLLNFDFGHILSSFTDTLSAAGQNSEIPSNIALPKQKETYIISVTLDKPVYRVKFPTMGPKKLMAARGRFVFKTVASELRNGKAFHELINHFTILGGGVRDLVVTQNQTNLDIPGTEMEFKNTLSVNTPANQSDEITLVLATNQVNGSMIPTDIKRAVNGKPTQLQSISNENAYVMSFLKKQSEFMSQQPGADRMSASLLPYSNGTAGKLLPLIANPTITSSDRFTIQLPNTPNTTGINPAATTISISDLVEIQDGEKRVTVANRKWEVYGLGWTRQVQLPKWPLANLNARKRVEVNYIGSTSNSKISYDESLIQNATHITHASADF